MKNYIHKLGCLTMIAAGLTFAEAPKIDQARINAALKQVQAQMQMQPGAQMPNQAEMTKRIMVNLQSAEVLKAEALKAGLDKQPETQAALQNLMAQFYAAQYVDYLKSQIQVNDADLRQQYDAMTREVNLLVIPYPSEADAQQGLDKLKKGLSFEALLKQQSPQAPSENWTPAQSLPPNVAQLVQKMTAGQIYPDVLVLNGQYFLMKVAGSRRAESAPPFDKVKAQLVEQTKNAKVQEAVEQLMKENGISLNP